MKIDDFKEIIICVIIVIIVVTFDFISSNYTKNSVSELEYGLNQMRQDLEKDDKDKEKIINDMIFIKKNWKEKFQKLAFYIEHDELEKVENDIYGIAANVETEEYEQAIENLERCKFLLYHIKDKEEFNLKNLF